MFCVFEKIKLKYLVTIHQQYHIMKYDAGLRKGNYVFAVPVLIIQP